MHITKRHSLTLLFAFFVICLAQAQNAQSPFMVPDQENHDFHRKCGIDHAQDALIAKNPKYAAEVKEWKSRIPQIVKAMKNDLDKDVNMIINIPVVVHVIHSGEPVGTGMNISDAQIEAQIEVLNEDFNALNDNFDETPAMWQAAIGNPEVNFCLAAIDPSGNATNGITRHNIPVTGTNSNNSNIEDEIKPATWWDSNLYYNIWVVPIPGTTAGGGTTGYAYLPTNFAVGSDIDGSVVDYNWFGGPGFGQSGDKTLTHETGHYLGLPHTFDGDACGADDGFADTPDIEQETSFYQPGLNCSPNNFPAGPTTCGNAHMYVNYMDYVNDDYCYTSFSNDQISLMRAVLMGNTGGTGFASREPLANNAVAVCSFFDNDAGVTTINNPETFVCGGGQITPEVIITNFGQNNLNSVTINYQINNNAPVSLVHTTNLATAGMETVSLAPYTPPGGAYTFTAYTTLPNGVTDEQLVNDTMMISTVAVVPLPLPLQEDFEDAAFNPTVNGLFTFDISGDGIVWDRSTAASGFGNGSASAMFDNYSTQRPNGTLDALITPIYDFSAVSGGQITFDVGYAIYQDPGQTLTDTLIMLVSTNCGINYVDQIFVKGGEDLASAPPTGGMFTPSANQWRTETVDLSAYDGEDNLSVMFVNYHGFGNRLFIDNINISLPCDMTVAQAGTDPNCSDSCDGTANVSPTGGSGTYSYTWSANANGATGPTATGLCGGDYMVTVSDGGSCTEVLTISLTAPDGLSAAISSTDETAVAANDGTATVTPSGGNNSNYDYLWSNALTTQTITDLTPGVYSVTVTDASGCTVDAFTSVAPYDCGSFGITLSGTNATCNGDNNGTATAMVNAGAGTPPYTYNWSNAAGNVATINDLTPDEYFVTVTDDKGCTATGSYIVTEPPIFTVSILVTHEMSGNANDGTATVTPFNGTPTITYVWNTGATTDMITGLAPATYTVTATDGNGCTDVISGTVNPGAVDCSGFGLSVSNTSDVSCNGDCDGSISLSVNSTATPFTFDWDDDALDGQQNPTNLCAGTYSVTVTDSDGCSATLMQGISEPQFLAIDWLASNINCFGECTGMITYDGAGGTAPYTAVISGGSFTNLCAGIYDLVLTDALGCTAATSIPITEFGPDDISATANGISCFGECDGSIVISAINNGPYFYEWSNGETTNAVNDLCPGTYNITVTNSQACSTVLTETVEDAPEMMLTISTTPLSGAGMNDATATASTSGGSPGYSYEWQPNGETTAMIGPLGPGTYTVTVTDQAGCTQEETVVINPFDCANFSAGIGVLNGISCFGECDGAISITASGGTMPITYIWSEPSFNGMSNPTNVCAGNYTVTVTEANGCSAILNPALGPGTPVVVSITGTQPSGPGANDGSATANPNGGVPGYTYFWSPTGGTTPTINNLAPATYNVIVTDANGCSATESFVIQDVDCSSFALGLSVTDITCFDANNGAAVAVPTGGEEPYNYNWSNSSTNNLINNLGPGTYAVTVTDNNGCSLEQSFTLTEPQILDIEISGTDETAAGANDGTATVNSTTGGTPNYNYLWCNGSSSTSVNNLPPGECGVTVTDANGCTVTAAIIIAPGGVDCSGFAATLNTEDVSCFGEMDGIANPITTGGTMPFSYAWSNAATSENLTNVFTGLYVVTITDAEGCQVIADGTIGSPDPIVPNITSTNETSAGANDGTASASPTGGTAPYTYQWCDGSTASSVMNLPPGICTVTITDINGCEEIGEAVIGSGNVDCSGFTAAVSELNPTCFEGDDGSVLTQLQGEIAPVTYTWSNSSTDPNLINIMAGEYSVTIVNGNGCEVVESITVFEPAPITVTVSSTPSTGGANDGTATITSTGGGTPGYTYIWCNGQTTETAINLAPGICNLSITDAQGCETIEQVIIENTTVDCSDFAVAVDAQVVSCFGLGDGAADAIVTGGTMPYTFLWSTTETTASISDLEPGQYFVTVVDANGCEDIQSGIVTQPEEITFVETTTNESAPGANDGTATLTSVTGGVGSYTYLWCNGQATNTATDLPGGTCSFTITDAIGCTTTGQVFIETTPTGCDGFEISMTTEALSCFNSFDGAASVQTTGGTAPFNFTWNTNETTAAINTLPAGPYSVTVVDALGCELIASDIVSQPLEVVVGTTAFDGNCGDAAAALALVTGGTAPFSYTWSNGINESFIDDLTPGIYQITVTDANGCTGEEVVLVQVSSASISVEAQVDATTCFGDSNGNIDLTMTSGTTPYTFLWSNGAITEDLSDMGTGTYTVLISDGAGCLYSSSYEIDAPAPLTIDFAFSPADNGSNGSITALASGGTSPYSYNWDGPLTATISNLNVGTYTVTITDANGCSAERSMLLGTSSTNELQGLTALDIFPNPTDGAFRIAAKFVESETVEVNVYNVLGQRIFAQMTNGSEVNVGIDIRNEASGTYLVQLKTGKGQVVKKVVKR